MALVHCTITAAASAYIKNTIHPIIHIYLVFLDSSYTVLQVTLSDAHAAPFIHAYTIPAAVACKYSAQKHFLVMLRAKEIVRAVDISSLLQKSDKCNIFILS